MGVIYCLCSRTVVGSLGLGFGVKIGLVSGFVAWDGCCAGLPVGCLPLWFSVLWGFGVLCLLWGVSFSV